MKIYFDLDDTLYSQYVPFKKAYQQCFSFPVDIYCLYQLSRQYNNQNFIKASHHEISFKQFYCQRIQVPLKQLGHDIDEQLAYKFQQCYQENQKQIELIPEIKELLDILVLHVELGIITNGPKDKQQAKIDALHLEKWFLKENIIISSKVHLEKPDQRIFDYANPQHETCLFIGDGYEIDIVGAKKAHWKTIWFNHKLEKQKGKLADYIVLNAKDLKELVLKLLKTEFNITI